MQGLTPCCIRQRLARFPIHQGSVMTNAVNIDGFLNMLVAGTLASSFVYAASLHLR